MKIDPLRSVEKVDAAIAADANPRHRAMLENFREHLLAEIEGSVERIMKTQVEEPSYQFWGMGIGDFGPKGGAGVRGFYQHIFEQGYRCVQRQLIAHRSDHRAGRQTWKVLAVADDPGRQHRCASSSRRKLEAQHEHLAVSIVATCLNFIG